MIYWGKRYETVEPVTVIPYLSFSGDCEKALVTYINAFGGEILYLSRWSEDNYDVSPDQIGKIMHVEFMLGSTRMAAGDSYGCADKESPIRLMVHKKSKEDAVQAIALLADGGTVITPLHPHPAPDDDGCGCVIRDCFGYTWIITCPNPEKKQAADSVK